MSRRAYIAILCLLAATAFFAGCGKKPPAPAPELEFSAVMVLKYQKTTVEDKINFTRHKQRVQPVNSDMGATIVRLDKGFAWYLMPAYRRYLQVPVRPEYKNPLLYMPDTIIKWEKVGEETVDGHPTIKEKMVIQNTGSDNKVSMYRWFATDIRWPIKAEDEKGDWKLSYKDIRVGRQDPSLFELPAGFVRIGNRMPD